MILSSEYFFCSGFSFRYFALAWFSSILVSLVSFACLNIILSYTN